MFHDSKTFHATLLEHFANFRGPLLNAQIFLEAQCSQLCSHAVLFTCLFEVE